MIQKEVDFASSNGLINGVLRIPEQEGSFPVVVICHGFMQTKDRELYFDLANELSFQRFITLRFDFLHHGESHGEITQASLTQMTIDIEKAIDFITAIPQAEEKIIVVGHDLGGMAAILVKDKRIKALCTIASRTSTDGFMSSYFSEYEIKEWKRDLYYDCHDIRLGIAFLNDIYKHNIIGSIEKKDIPMLFINGTNDKRTPSDEAKRLFYHSKDGEFILVDGADHNFTDKTQRNSIIEQINDWIKRKV